MSEAGQIQEYPDLYVPPFEKFCGILGIKPEEGMPVLEKLPRQFVLPREVASYSREIDRLTRANQREASGFIDVVGKDQRLKSIPIRLGTKHVAWQAGIMGNLRAISGRKALIAIHGHLLHPTFVPKDLASFKTSPEMAYILLVTHQQSLRCLVQTKKTMNYPLAPALVDLATWLKAEKAMWDSPDDDREFGRLAEKNGFGYYLGGLINKNTEITMKRVTG